MKTRKMRSAILVVLPLVLAVPAYAADANSKERFMDACVVKQKKKSYLCECMYESSVISLSAREMDLQIAILADDTKRQSEIKSEQGFDYKAYNDKGTAILMKAIACVQSRQK
jgi:hypothetical protein